MKTKVIAIAFFVLMSLLTSKAQTYQPVFGINSTKYSQLGEFGSYEYTINRDTIVNGLKYKITFFGLVRSSLDNSKLYIRSYENTYTTDKEEYLIMDLNMKLGDKFIANDTLRFKNNYPMQTGSDTVTVDSVFFLNGLKHIRFDVVMIPTLTMAGGNIKYKLEFIEGVGPNVGFLLRPLASAKISQMGRLPILCTFKDGIKFYSTNLFKGTFLDGSCDYKTGVENTKKDNINIYPNPASTKIIVSIDEIANSNYNAEILDITGKTIFSTQIERCISEISINRLPSSIYLIRLTSENSKPFCKQFIVKRI